MMLGIGTSGPILLEDAVDLAAMAVQMGRTVPANKWVDELRMQSEGDSFAGFGA